MLVPIFFLNGWILPGFNSNSIVLIPKTKGVAALHLSSHCHFEFRVQTDLKNHYRQAGDFNFISSFAGAEGFYSRKQIHDCIGLVSEAVNLRNYKVWCSNLALKVDIKKAFDTLNQGFFLKDLSSFGFNNNFCSWISYILHYAHLSININGVLRCFFRCSRGVCQGDPLSPLLFCLVEDVLSRKILQLVSSNRLELNIGPQNIMVPFHILYADDVLIYCKAKISNIKNIISIFNDYEVIYGQVVNGKKSFIFDGVIQGVHG